MTHTSYRKLTAGLITAWFVFALIAGSLAWFQTDATQPPLPLLFAVLIPVTLYAAWYFASKSFRDFVLSLNPATLTQVQAWRIVGFAFVALSAVPHSSGQSSPCLPVGETFSSAARPCWQREGSRALSTAPPSSSGNSWESPISSSP